MSNLKPNYNASSWLNSDNPRRRGSTGEDGGGLFGTNRNQQPHFNKSKGSNINTHKNNTNSNFNDDEGDDVMPPAPFIAIHRPSVAYDPNGGPLLAQLKQHKTGAAPLVHDSADGVGDEGATVFGRSHSRAVSPSPSMMRGVGIGGGSFAMGNHGPALGGGGLSVSRAGSNRSFSVSHGAGGAPAVGHSLHPSGFDASNNSRMNFTERLSMMRERRSMMRQGSIGVASRQSPQNISLQSPQINRNLNFGASRGGVGFAATNRSPKSPNGNLAVDRGPAVRIKSPGGMDVRVPGSRDSDRERSESETDSSHSTSDSSSSASSSTFSIGSSLNFDRVKSYFLRRKRGKKFIALNSSSMYIFSGDNKFRIVIFNLLRSKAFEAFVILLIVGNCVLLALNSPDQEEALWQVQTDYFFTAAFSAEAIMKLFAFGVVLHPGAYFRDPWNILDFLIVVLSFVQLLPQIGNFTALRIFRVLRPLRSLNAVPPLKVIVSGLLHSVKGLANVGILSLIIVGIFSIIGVQLWQGKMRYRCQDDFTEDIFDEMYCSTSDVGAGFTGRLCPAGFSCVPHKNPWMGYVNFDNVLWAFLIVFQCITCEGWSEIQDVTMNMVGWYSAIYFILVVVILNYFILNLALAVINFQFLNAKERMEERLREEREEEEMEMLAAAEEDEDYQRMLLPDEEKNNLLGMYKDTEFEVADAKATSHDGFDRAAGHLSSAQLRMLKKTVGGRLIYSMEKSARIQNLAIAREAERKEEALLLHQMQTDQGALNVSSAVDDVDFGVVSGSLKGKHRLAIMDEANSLVEMRLHSNRSPLARNPLKIGSPTAAALALIAAADPSYPASVKRSGQNSPNNSPRINSSLDQRLNTTVSSGKGAAAGGAHSSRGEGTVPAITLDVIPPPSRATSDSALVSTTDNAAAAAAGGGNWAALSRPVTSVHGSSNFNNTSYQGFAAADPTPLSGVLEASEMRGVGSSRAHSRMTDGSGGVAPLALPPIAVGGAPHRLSVNPPSKLSGPIVSTSDNEQQQGSNPRPTPSPNKSNLTDDIVRISAKQKLNDLNMTLGAAGGIAGGDDEDLEGSIQIPAEEIDFEEASVLGSVDETPQHQRGYLRRKFDAKFGHLSWYRFTYKSPLLMHLWRVWLRVRYYFFAFSEGDPYAWHAFDFEKLRQAAARDLADEDISKKKIPEPSSTFFTKFVVFCVVVNTGFMCASHYGESELQTKISGIANIVFAAIFGLEMFVRLTAIGFHSYVFDVSNFFDGVITIISLVEVIFLTGSSSFSVLRAFRLLRIFKLMKAIPSLRKILRVAIVAIQDTGYLCVIFLLYLFIAALVGMQLFGNNLKHTADDPRANFRNFYMSFYTVFEILTRDSWPDIMRMTMRDVNVVACIYYLICVFIGDFIILNLFLAILISSFDSVADEADDDEFERYRDVDAIKRRPLGTMGALVSEQSKRLLRLADHKLRIVEPDAFLKDADVLEQAALLADDDPANAAAECDGVGGGVRMGIRINHNNMNNQNLLLDLGMASDEARGEVCHLCGEVKRQPFPPPSKLIAPMTADELHGRMCARIALRKAKARVIRDLLEEIGGVGALDSEELTMTMNKVGLSVHQQLQSYKFGEFDVGLGFDGVGVGGNSGGGGGTGISLRSAKPTPETVDELFGRAWEAGLLLNRNADDYFHINSWAPIAGLLKEEQLVLNLHVGEEVVGQSLIAYTRANVPREFFTNGGKSLWLFSSRNRFRVVITQIITNPWFDRIVMGLIVFSSVLMAFDNPREPPIQWMVILGRVFTLIFTLEALMKIVAYGFILHPTAYARDLWNVLDGGIVVISLIAWILESVTSGNQLQAIKVLRTLRCLRPLRVINRNRGLRMVISTLILSMKGIANVALINGLVYLIFAILGVQLFSGSLHYCNDGSIFLKENCAGNYTVEEFVAKTQEITKVISGRNVTGNITYYDLENVTTDRLWKNADFNFDNTYLAFINLLHIVTLDNWGETMWAVIDSTGPNKGPIENNRPYWGLYFVVFITVGCFFLLNMFVGVIISSFAAVKEKMDGSSMLTKDQKLWVETQRLMLNFRPELRRRPVFPNLALCQWLFRIAESYKFEAITGLGVALNVIFIGLDHYGETDAFASVLQFANYVFLGLFTIEALVKLGAYGFQYFRSGWNCFDFFLVLIGFVDIILDGVLPINLGILRVFRVFRIMRMLVLVRRARSVRVLLETLWYSLPSLVNIGTFLLLIFFMYAVLGNQLFAKVKRTHGMTDNVNFENFGTSFLFLIQLVTLDNWGTIMLATMNTEDCAGDECGTPWAPLYFYTFIIIASWVIMNLFVAIILDNFDNTMRLDKSKLKMAHLKKFTDSWSEFDPEATLIMETRNFPSLLLSLHSPLGIDRVTDRKRIMQLADGYRIVEHGGVIHFVETMVPMARRVLAVEFSEAELRAHEDHWRVQFPSLAKLKILRYRMKRVTVDQYFGATYLSAAYRRRAAYRYVEMLRKEKLAQMEQWYETHGVALDQRVASYRLLERTVARRQATDQFTLRKAENADEATSQATSRANSRLGLSMGASEAALEKRAGSLHRSNANLSHYSENQNNSYGLGLGADRSRLNTSSGGGSANINVGANADEINTSGVNNQIIAVLAPRRGSLMRGASSGRSNTRESRWKKVPELMGIGRSRKRSQQASFNQDGKFFF